jgi:DnaJ-class molecular chaperone with C-terminal Zn finger domain
MCRLDALRQREWDLIDRNAHVWLFELPPEARPILTPAVRDVFRRGFIVSVSLTLDGLIGCPCESCRGTGESAMVQGLTTRQFRRARKTGLCPTCHGSGRVEGIAARLAGLPLEAVTLTDREPWGPLPIRP